MVIIKVVIGILAGAFLFGGLLCIIDTILERPTVWKEDDSPPPYLVIPFGVILIIMAIVGILFICLK